MIENAIALPVEDTVPLDQVRLFNYDEGAITSLVFEVVNDLIDQAASESENKVKQENLVVVANEDVEMATNNHQQLFENGLTAVQGNLAVDTVKCEMSTHSHQQLKRSSVDTITSNPNSFMDRVKFEAKRKRKVTSFVEKTTSQPKKIALDKRVENSVMVTHSHQIQLEQPKKATAIHSQQHEDYIASWTSVNEKRAKMFKQLNGTVFVLLENCTNMVGIKEEPIDVETVADPIPGLDGWMCTSCSYVSPKKFNVSQHIHYKHSSTRAFNCVTCAKPFKTNRDLQRHETKCQGKGRPMPGRPLGSIQTSRT